MSNDGMNYFPNGIPPMPKPRPKPTLTGSWSDPYFAAEPGQTIDAAHGEKDLREYYNSKKGGVYAADPKTMGMEHGIDIHQQIQDSIDGGRYMRSVLDQAIKSGRPVQFDSAKWGGASKQSSIKAFNDGVTTPNGRTVGRWGGFVQGTLSATPDGRWSVSAGLWPQKTGQYDPATLDGKNWVQDADIEADKILSGKGTPFYVNFNRVFNFKASGNYAR